MSSIEAKPFLVNPQIITDFISSASAASAQSEPSENISDYTKQTKPKKLVEAKSTEQDLLEALMEEEPPGDSNGQNDVLPTLVQKKIGKVLRKIQLITRLSNNGADNQGNEGGGDLDDFADEFDDSTEVTTEAAAEEVEVDKEVEEVVTEVQQPPVATTVKPGISGNFMETANNIGVFFMELIGSIVGLAYGAVAQISASPRPWGLIIL